MTPTARLIVDPALSGSWNMAVDQSILEASANSNLMTLRFYQWAPATVSLGYFQKLADRETHEFSRQSPLVRRSTGGGAIVHDRELTYSLCVPGSNPWSGDNQQLYSLVHQALISCLDDYGIQAEQVAETVKQKDEPFLCFQRRSIGDVLLDGEKICGSAQRRVERSILQHGSILLYRSEAAPELPGVCDLGSDKIEVSQLSNDLIREIEKRMKVSFKIAELTAEEHSGAVKIQHDRFESDRWTAKR